MMCTLGLSANICNLLVAASDALASSCAAKLAAVRAAGMPSAGSVKALATELAAEAARANAWFWQVEKVGQYRFFEKPEPKPLPLGEFLAPFSAGF